MKNIICRNETTNEFACFGSQGLRVGFLYKYISCRININKIVLSSCSCRVHIEKILDRSCLTLSCCVAVALTRTNYQLYSIAHDELE